MKKNVITIAEGVLAGGIMGIIFLWVFYAFFGKFPSLYFYEETTLFLFILLGISLSFMLSYKKRSELDEEVIAKHKDDNKSKDDMISMTLHHIRTPLTGMMWSTKELTVETPADHPQKNRIEKLHDETVRVLGTVEKLLKTARENTGRSSYCFELYSSEKLERLISESISKMKPAAYAKDISVETETSPLSLKSAKIDSDKIITVVQTLFENAIHYTKSGGGIKIHMEEKGDNFFFHISDTGIGIPSDEQSRIFTQFYRSTNAKRVRSDGLGIGLYLAKSFVDAHGGTLSFVSTPHGTTFTVRISLVEPSQVGISPKAQETKAASI
ncbi:MAG: HAMP domain-containing sensor histidine kinase [Candidatus Paceibacterota bacterium]|jgi:signal transduction histidine kinase|nr:HAMP domain-containing histidine kinase [Candidatus Paceibacterota bacterium]